MDKGTRPYVVELVFWSHLIREDIQACIALQLRNGPPGVSMARASRIAMVAVVLAAHGRSVREIDLHCGRSHHWGYDGPGGVGMTYSSRGLRYVWWENIPSL